MTAVAALLQEAGFPALSNGSSLEAELSGTEYVLLYLSASWCPPCRAFTPTLSEWAALQPRSTRVIFISGDKSAEDAAAYHSKMSFPMAVFNPSAFQALMRKFGCFGIPTLVVLKASDGSVVTTSG